MKAGPSQEEIRRHNLSTVLRHVHIGGPASRTVLAERMGVNRSTVLGLVSELTAAGLVREELPATPAGRGGPRWSYGPSPHARTSWPSTSASTV